MNSSNFENAVSCLIDFTMAIPETSQLSSEEIFVSCCLVLSDKISDGSLFNLMGSYFQSSLGKGLQVKQVIKQHLADILGE